MYCKKYCTITVKVLFHENEDEDLMEPPTNLLLALLDFAEVNWKSSYNSGIVEYGIV
jgi:hypothetical protein